MKSSFIRICAIVLALISLSPSATLAQTAGSEQPAQFTEPIEVSEMMVEFVANERHYFESTKNDALEVFWQDQGLEVARPYWRRLDLINEDQNFYKTNVNHNLVLDQPVEALMFKISKVRDTDKFSLSISDSKGNKDTYHNMRDVIYKDAGGSYDIQLNSNVFDQVQLQIFAADRVYPSAPVVLITNEETANPNHEEQFMAYLGRGGTLINLGSVATDEHIKKIFGPFEELKLEGEKESIHYLSGSYIYIPEALFVNEDLAMRVVKSVTNLLPVDEDQKNSEYIMTLILILFTFAVLGLLFQHRKTAKSWAREHVLPRLHTMAVWGIIWAVIIVLVLPVMVYWYKNFSGLDLFPHFTIDQFLAKYNLRLLSKLFLAIIAFIIILFAGLIAWLGEEETSVLQRMHNRIKGMFSKKEDGQRDWFLIILMTAVVVCAGFVFFMRSGGVDGTGTMSFQGKILLPQGVFETYTSTPMTLSKELAEAKVSSTFPSSLEIEKVVGSLGRDSETANWSKKIMYLELRHAQYFADFNRMIEGELVVRNKNKEFGNKDMFIHLMDLDGKHKATVSIAGREDLLGSGQTEYVYPFVFTLTSPGIYGIKLENSDALRFGDYEIISLKLNTKQIHSLNEIMESAWHQVKVTENDYVMAPYQYEKLRNNKFWLRMPNQLGAN